MPSFVSVVSQWPHLCRNLHSSNFLLILRILLKLRYNSYTIKLILLASAEFSSFQYSYRIVTPLPLFNSITFLSTQKQKLLSLAVMSLYISILCAFHLKRVIRYTGFLLLLLFIGFGFFKWRFKNEPRTSYTLATNSITKSSPSLRWGFCVCLFHLVYCLQDLSMLYFVSEFYPFYGWVVFHFVDIVNFAYSHPSINGHLSFHLSAIMNNDAMNIALQFFV